MTWVRYTTLVDDECVELVLAKDRVIKGKAEVQTELEVKREEDFFTLAFCVLENWKSEDYEVGKANWFEGW